jgi:hypothetical protein
MKSVFLGTAAAVALLAASSQAAIVSTSTDGPSFQAALDPRTNVTFSGPAVTIDENTPATLYNIAFSVTGTSSFDDLVVGGGDLDYGVGTTSYTSITLLLPVPVNAFGGSFIGANSLGGTTFTTNTGDSVAIGASLPAPGTGSFGFVTSSFFNSITLTSTTGQLELATISDIVYGTAAAVPEPTTLAMLSLGGLALLRRRN